MTILTDTLSMLSHQFSYETKDASLRELVRESDGTFTQYDLVAGDPGYFATSQQPCYTPTFSLYVTKGLREGKELLFYRPEFERKRERRERNLAGRTLRTDTHDKKYFIMLPHDSFCIYPETHTNPNIPDKFFAFFDQITVYPSTRSDSHYMTAFELLADGTIHSRWTGEPVQLDVHKKILQESQQVLQWFSKHYDLPIATHRFAELET